MDTDINAEWTATKRKIQAKWNKLTDTEVEGLKGNMHLISEKLQKAYGYSKDKAVDEYNQFAKLLAPAASPAEKAKAT